MATISRFKAVALIGKFRLTGFLAWLAWLALHLIYITGFKSRLTALMHWFVSFLGRGRSERTTTEQQIYARAALQRLRAGRRTWSRPRARTTGRRRSSRSPGGPSSRRGPWKRLGSPTPASAGSTRTPSRPEAPPAQPTWW